MLVTRYVTLTNERGMPLSDVPIVMYDAHNYDWIYNITNTDPNGVAYFTEVAVPEGSHYAFRPRIRRSAGLMGAPHNGDDTDNGQGSAMIGAVHLTVVAIEEGEEENIPTAAVEYIDSGTEAGTECTDISLLLDNTMWEFSTFMPLNAVAFIFERRYSVSWDWNGTGVPAYWIRQPYLAPDTPVFTGATVSEQGSVVYSQRTLLGGPAGDIDTINAWAKIWEVRPDPHAPHVFFGLPGFTREGVMVKLTHSSGTLQVRGFYTPCVEDEATVKMKLAVTAPPTGREHRIRTDVSQDEPFTQEAGILFMFFSSYPNGESDTGTAYINGTEVHETNNHITYPSVIGPNNGEAAIDWPDYSLLAFSLQFASTSPHEHDLHCISIPKEKFQDALGLEPEEDVDDMICIFWTIADEDWDGVLCEGPANQLLNSQTWHREGGDQFVKVFGVFREGDTDVEIQLDFENRIRLTWAMVAVPDYLSILQTLGQVQDPRGDFNVDFPVDFVDTNNLTVVGLLHNEDDLDDDDNTPEIGPELEEDEESDWEQIQEADDGDPETDELPLHIQPGGLLNLHDVPVLDVYWQIGQEEFDVRNLLGVLVASEVSQEEPEP